MVRGLSPNHRNGERHTVWAFCPCRKKRGTCHTTKMGSPTLVLLTHFAIEIILLTFLNQRCERPSSGFECHLTTDVGECIWWIYALSWHINGGTNTMYFWHDNTLELWPTTSRGLLVTYVTVCYLSRLTPTGPQWLAYVGLCFHTVWCYAKGVGDIEIIQSVTSSFRQ